MDFGYLQPEMNGDNEAIMKALLTFSQMGASHVTQMRSYMSELWARGVTKEQFLAWAKEQDSAANKG
jgi:hypothetical protein